ncbi:MAG: type VI secretion system tube protein Hcp [Saprospiraceae bacterium]|nr:type VI secretion system tube protein Hcp [Saprospiraceae bacterium]
MNRLIFTMICLLFSLATLTAQGYIKFDGIDGEASDPMHKGWSDIASFSVGMNSTVSAAGAAGGRAAGKTSFGDLIITKNIDKSSPKLMEYLATGKYIPKVELHLAIKARDGKSNVYLRYELKNVFVTSYQISGNTDDSNSLAAEQINLSYASLHVFYVEMDGTGKPKGEVPFKWDVKANRAGNE